ncbi:MAG: preprotein translocase subunit SecE [Ruminococcaceae bacterium]|nr:preprotein translocase subunit SecE [Oscillospiraceae bacterium]
MAEKEIKEVKQAPKKVKSDKPSLFSRLAAFFKSCKAEMKKIVWSSWTTVRSNTLMVLVSIIVISAAIGIVDLLFSQGIVILSILVK